MAKINIQDDSGDRKYFTIVPNYILNHSTDTDQALYLQMKRYAGEDGKCFATQETLMAKLGIGRQAYNKSLEYLIKRGWVEFVGLTGGKTRPIKTYKINNIWSENNDFYEKIPSETAVSSNKEIPSEMTGDTVQNSSKIPSETAIEEDPLLRRTIKKNQVYGEFKNVKLSLEEYQKLIDRFTETTTLSLIEELSSYIASKGKRYSSHYATLLNWAKRKSGEKNYKSKGITII